MTSTTKKVHVSLSLPEQTNRDLNELATGFGMTKSGLVNFLINKTKASGTDIFK